MSKKYLKLKIGVILLLVTLFSICTCWMIGASLLESEPDVNLFVFGEKSKGGPIFSNDGDMGAGLWAPGRSNSGTLRIHNNYSQSIRVSNLGLSMTLEKLDDGAYKPVEDPALLEEFAKNMKLEIRKGAFLSFDKLLYDKSFYEMLYIKNDSNHQGCDLPASDRFDISRDSHADFKYTVHMDEDAGNNLQGLRATVAFLFNVHENPDVYVPPVESGTHSANNITASDEIIELEDEEIPKSNTGDSNHWAHDCIETLLEHGIIEPYADGTIKPDNNITRAETAVLICKALNIEPIEKPKAYYKDRLPRWARGYIMAAREKRIFLGYPDKRFRPNSFITREEMTAVLVRAFKLKTNGYKQLTFKDKDDIGKWAVSHVRVAYQNKVIEGYPDNTFRPKANMTRAEAFTIICRLLNYHEEHK